MLDMALVPQNEPKQRQRCRTRSTSSESFDGTFMTQPESSVSPSLSPSASRGARHRRRNRRRNVSFGVVVVREYQVTLSDHPCVIDGPPVGLDWSYSENAATDVDTYEADRLTTNERRTLNQLRMGPSKRRNMLLRQGHTQEELMQAMKDVRRVQNNRRKTQAFLPALPATSRKFEKAAKKVAHAVDKASTISIAVVNALDVEAAVLE